MRYQVLITKRAQSEIAALDSRTFQRINEAILALAENPRPPGCKKLKDREGWRIRVGDYRVLYEIQDDVLLVLVVEVGHRKYVYR